MIECRSDNRGNMREAIGREDVPPEYRDVCQDKSEIKNSQHV